MEKTRSQSSPAPPDPGAGMPRRDFLRAGVGVAAAGAGVVLAGAGRRPRAHAGPASRPGRAGPGRARNLIFMVVDGMSVGTLTLGDMHRRMRDGRPSRWVELLSAPANPASPRAQRALVDTASVDGHVTDSAAAASAWGIGERVANGAVNVTPDGREPTPLFVRAAREGRAQGLVTTTRLTDATPACFVANAPRRSFEREIAGQIIERGVDVLLGGGGRFFTPELLAERPDATIVRTREALRGLDAAKTPRLFGFFADDHMSYEIDRGADEPSLAEMTAAALGSLGGRPDGFVLMIEGARVDHGAHANDAVGMVHDMAAFDEALRVASDFCAERDDTLLIATTDHANANPGLATYAPDGVVQFERLMEAEHSLAWVMAELGARAHGPETSGAMADLITEAMKIKLRHEEVELLDRWIAGERVDPYERRNRRTSPVGSLISNHFGVAFTGPDHTSDFVEALAIGPGAEALAPFIGIEQLHDIAAAALGLAPV